MYFVASYVLYAAQRVNNTVISNFVFGWKLSPGSITRTRVHSKALCFYKLLFETAQLTGWIYATQISVMTAENVKGIGKSIAAGKYLAQHEV